MKTTLPILLLITFSVINCRSSEEKFIPNNLTKLSNQELIERARVGNFPDLNELTYMDEQGKIITRDSLILMQPFDELAFDDYADESGVVKITIVRPAKEKDKVLRKKINKAIEEGPKLNKIIINCNDLGSLLDTIYTIDQMNRKTPKDLDPEVDFKNLETVVSILDQCGIPTLKDVSERQLQAIWLVIQHSDTRYQKKYLRMFKKAADLGDLDKKHVLTMEDRILVYDNKPQVYGTQIRVNSDGSYELIKIIDPEYVNQRRREAGFPPIEDYLLDWGIIFDVPQKQK